MRYDDLCSPVLVKEVRQALRGRAFAVGFMSALGLALMLAGVSFLEGGGGTGERVVMPIYFVLIAALLVYVPFHAHQSMRQEDAEGARDLLALSPMGPWRIVLGKLAAALVLAALILAAFLPFVVVIALQPAVDTFGVLVLLVHVCSVAVFLTALGVACGAMRPNRFGRGAGGVILAFITLGILAYEVRLAEGVFNSTIRVGATGLAVAGWLGFGAVAPLLLGFAAAALARDDRDLSRGLRIAWLTFACAASLALSLCMPGLGADAADITVCAVVAILAGTFVAAVVVTEDERLDTESLRRLARVRRGPLRVVHGLLAVGGGRGVALTLALGVLISVSALIGLARVSTVGSPGLPGLTYSSASTYDGLEWVRAAIVLATAIGVSLAFAVFPAHVLGSTRRAPSARRIARWASAISMIVLSLCLPLLLIAASRGGFDEDALFFSPLFVLLEAGRDIDRSRVPDGEVFLWIVIGFVAFIVAAPSLQRGLREVLEREPPPAGPA